MGEETRSGLWTEYARLIGEIKPRWIIIENVPGLLSIDSGRGMGKVLYDLAVRGYNAEWDCISAASVGALHRRDRIFIVANSRHFGGRYGFAGGIGRNGSRQMDNGQRTATPVEAPGSSKTPGALSYTDSQKLRIESKPFARCDSPSLAGNDGKKELLAYSNGLRLQEYDLCQSGVFIESGQVLADPEGRESGEPSKWEGREDTSRGSEKVVNTSDTDNAGLEGQRAEYRLFTQGGTLSRPPASDWWAVEPNVGRVANGVPARMDRLRALGNAVVPQVAEHIGRLILEYERSDLNVS